ncbi:dTDP-4-dehydrorhamnose reductase [Candidatus Parcubacteria bacterium]|nr:dTDP-4-dehydrorhamnose reductase [Patescibacteria group bacterium]MBU4309129.1 dTDP-4-dehydrorhamnose reductase [Patescibacteria group bacterium]MBU4432184.1 dTDP-4-dehydrorhamnose reductase [Patescibacteria group bacterium]MBU4577490.1 dTDP-4-dehydrorhamnose reductase [Patescibacteria group bacterium]MCG2697177.1 dTDP-4-dehydrorhamnose reductase [Candidatus Parcubacteria bacterium]
MNKILLVGAQGNLGGQLKKVFAKYDVYSWDRDEIDIANREQVMKKITDLEPNVIINAAAYNAVDKCEADEAELQAAQTINGDAPGFLAEAALEVGATLIHYSSDYVFNGEVTEEFREDAQTNPINKYGETKLAGEKNVLRFSDQGLKYFIVRLSKLFGPKGESEVAKPSFFDVMLKLGRERESIDVVNEERSCFTYSPDLALWTKKLLESDSTFGIYHFVNEGACTWYESVLELYKMADINIRVNAVTSDKFPRPAKRPTCSVLVNTKFEKMRSYQDALKEYLSQL